MGHTETDLADTELARIGHDEAAPFALDEATLELQPNEVGGVFDQRFRLDGELGHGAMGRVLLALDTQTGQQVALKILHPAKKRAGGGAAGSEERFLREVVALSEIDHPAVVRILSHARTHDGRWWIAMELLEGETLAARLAREGPMSLAQAWPILSTLAGGLAAAHRAGFVHRDLKPANVFLPERARPPCKILDFGFARHQSKQARITATGALIGTPRFMAPEILADAQSIDARVDVYGLGVLAFEVLTGRSIYPADDFGQLMGCILAGRTIALRQVLPDAPEALEQLLRDATAREPRERLASAELFALRLAEIVGHRSDGPQYEGRRGQAPVAIAATRITLPAPSAAEPPQRARRVKQPPKRPVVLSLPRERSRSGPREDTPAASRRSSSRRHAGRIAAVLVGVLVAVAVAVFAVAWRLAP